ncbi:hypothetical protein [Haladaptatus sp. DJG-WS-42]|uniref:hypothetical protein n=1 Tax=Haladaptatus sp. DJG-WS-42 TaxID=3120516 RepID=UPI0030D04176
MRELIVDMAAELFAVLIYAVSAGAITTLSLAAEFTGIENLTTGHLTMGLWFAYMGLVLGYLGIALLGRQKLLPALYALGTSDN